MDASAIFSATKWIGPWLIEEGKYLYGVRDHVGRLQDELKCMLGHLEQSDRAQQYGEEEDPLSAVFTNKIRQIAFDAEDVIDTYILQVESEMEGRSALTKCFHFLVSILLIHQTRNQIDSIIKEARAANEWLRRINVEGTASSNNILRSRGVMLETYGHTKDEIVVGFDIHIQALVEQLTDANSKSPIIGIVGTGGAGKSTLARKVFQHPHVTSYFKHKAWLCISQQWDRKNVLYEILRKTRGIKDESERNNRSEGELIGMIYDFLKEQLYLLVLDDTWDKRAWDDIRDALPQHHKGSKIIITTRVPEVLSYADHNCVVLEPRLLHGEESWVLFKKIAIDGRNSTSADVVEFEILGKKMVAKCGGLPLAIVTLGGLLRSQDSLDDWERINKACGDAILKDGGADRIIALTYRNLPFCLKPCFLYLGVFPEDVKIKGTLLTQLWIAEGLITEDQQRGQEILEDVAKRRLRRCILQVVRRNYSGIAKEFRLHDLLRDYCIKRAKDQSFLHVFSPMDQFTLDAKVSSLQARRAIFHSGISYPAQSQHLRSLVRFGTRGPCGSRFVYEDQKVIKMMRMYYKNFKLLRVLNLHGIITLRGELSNEIGTLLHLRYLAIKGSNIKMFPKSIGNLRNLLTLDLRPNSEASKIAFSVSNMSQLRHLYMDRCGEIVAENFGLDKLKGLQILKGIKAGSWMVKEMYALRRGIEQLEIKSISSSDQLEAVYQCVSSMLDSLRTITLDWRTKDKNLKFDLEKLENCHHLKKLRLWGRINGDNSVVKPLRFPPNIVSLYVEGSRLQGQDWITALGRLQHLKFLNLNADAYEGTQLKVGAFAFPQLEKLSIAGLFKLKEWRIEEGAFPCLKVLTIGVCPKLQRIPQGLKAITTLQELSINSMPASFFKRLGWQESDGTKRVIIKNTPHHSTEDGRGLTRSGEDFLFIQHVPTIEFWLVVLGK